MIDGKNFFDRPIKNNKVTYENIRKIAPGQGDNYTTITITKERITSNKKCN